MPGAVFLTHSVVPLVPFHLLLSTGSALVPLEVNEFDFACLFCRL